MSRQRVRAIRSPFVVAVPVTVLDLGVKAAVREWSRGSTTWGFLRWGVVSNSGVSFSFASNSGRTILLATAIVTFVIGIWALTVRRGWPSLAVGLVLGGGLANTTERLVSPHHVVTDYLNVNNMFVCNLADICLTVGVAIVLLMGLRGVSWR